MADYITQLKNNDDDNLYPIVKTTCLDSELPIAKGGTGVTSIAAIQTELGIKQYSATEVRVGTWVNGKPLYRTVTPVTKTATGTTTYSNIIPANVSILVRAKIFAISAGSDTVDATTEPYYYSSSNFWRIYVSTPYSRAISIESGGSWPKLPLTIYVDMLYTKTTDLSEPE